MEVVVGCIIRFGAGVGNFDLNYYGKAVVLLSVGFGEKCDRWREEGAIAFSLGCADQMPIHPRIGRY